MLDMSKKGNIQLHSKGMDLLNHFNKKVIWHQRTTNSTEQNLQFDLLLIRTT